VEGQAFYAVKGIWYSPVGQKIIND